MQRRGKIRNRKNAKWTLVRERHSRLRQVLRDSQEKESESEKENHDDEEGEETGAVALLKCVFR